MEQMKVLDHNGNPTGLIKSREAIHTDGDVHGVVRIYVVRYQKDNWEVLMQKRSERCEAFPGYYDISCAGHIFANEESYEAALREIKEELGLQSSKKLTYLFSSYEYWPKYSANYVDREYNDIYIYTDEVNLNDIILQEEEVEYVIWMDFESLIPLLDDTFTKYCVFKNEILKVYDYLKERI